MPDRFKSSHIDGCLPRESSQRENQVFLQSPMGIEGVVLGSESSIQVSRSTHPSQVNETLPWNNEGEQTWQKTSVGVWTVSFVHTLV